MTPIAHMVRGTACLLTALLLAGSAADAQEWTRFRGPNGSGIGEAKDIPAVWTEQDIHWKVKLPAAGHSSPSLWGDKIFLTGSDNATATRAAFCVSATDGKILWSRNYASSVHKRHQLNSFSSATAAVDAERVYVCWTAPEEYTFLALDHAGEEVWRKNLGPFISQHSGGVSPVIYEDLVILPNDQDAAGSSFIIAMNRKTGEEVWRIARESILVAYSTPCLYTPEGGSPQLIFNQSQGGMFGVDPLKGKILWESAKLIDKRSVSSPVITSNGLITISCGSGGGGNFLVAAKPGSATAPAEMVYKVDKQAPYVPTPLAYGKWLFLFGDKGFATCLDAETGDPIWQKRLGGDFYGSPICVDGKLICVSAQGEVIALAASDEFEELGRTPLNETCHSTPAVAGGRLYVRTVEHLYSVGGKK